MSKQKKKQKWYAGGLRFQCFQCGACCSGLPGYVWVTEQEIKNIAKFLNMEEKEFFRKYLRRVGTRISLKEKLNYDCIFLERTNGQVRCKIYPVRPKQCRTWPFWHNNLKDPDSWCHAGKRCPGINRGRLYQIDEIEKILKSSPC